MFSTRSGASAVRFEYAHNRMDKMLTRWDVLVFLYWDVVGKLDLVDVFENREPLPN